MNQRSALCCFAFTVAPGGVISLSKHYPVSEGANFLDFCADEESRERWRTAYSKCFALREPQTDIRVRVRLYDDRVIHLVSDLHWDGGERVVFYVRREWPLNLLTEREQEVLQLIAGGQDAKTIARVMDTTPDNARATISRVRKKLKVVHDDGMLEAALYFREADKPPIRRVDEQPHGDQGSPVASPSFPTTNTNQEPAREQRQYRSTSSPHGSL